MRRTLGIAVGVATAAVIAVVAASCGSSTSPANKQYVANMIGANEGTGRTSPGSGVVTFVDLGTEIDWTMTLTNITNVTASHIHLGPATVVGPVIFSLFIPTRPPETGTLNGVVKQGIITNTTSATISLDSLRVLFNNGNAYANVHTLVNPGGEIRDQIHLVP